jgi:hypothetical protein
MPRRELFLDPVLIARAASPSRLYMLVFRHRIIQSHQLEQCGIEPLALHGEFARGFDDPPRDDRVNDVALTRWPRSQKLLDAELFHRREHRLDVSVGFEGIFDHSHGNKSTR